MPPASGREKGTPVSRTVSLEESKMNNLDNNEGTTTITPSEKSSSSSSYPSSNIFATSDEDNHEEEEGQNTSSAAAIIQKTPSPMFSSANANNSSFLTANHGYGYEDEGRDDEEEAEDRHVGDQQYKNTGSTDANPNTAGDGENDDDEEEQPVGGVLKDGLFVYGEYVIDPADPMASWKGEQWNADEVRI